MASKRKRGRSRANRTRSVSKPILDFSTSLERAHTALEKNQAESAKHYAEKALGFVSPTRNPQAVAAANQFLAEAHFRLAVASPLAQEQESHLDAALLLAPAETRFHFHRAIALFRQSRLADAAAALDKARGHHGAAFLGALLQLAQGEPWDEKGLTSEEINTLRLLQAVREEKPTPSLRQLAQENLLSAHEIWQALLDLRADASAVTPEHLTGLAGALASREAQGILHYYAGVAALSQGRRKEAADVWSISAASGWNSSWLTENSEFLGREDVIALAQEEKWEEIVRLAEQIPATVSDRILSETIGTAYFTLGYQAAEAAQWQKAAELLRTASTYVGGRTLSQNLALCEEALENWSAAGDAWREMARRRPRSENHPDYMTDAQVAALWAHAAECYDHSDYIDDEVVNCLRTAVKYAEDDIDLRTKLVDALSMTDRDDAAENELLRILEIDENHIPTLLHLAHLAADEWDGNPLPRFRQVLALEPSNQEARDGLAEWYLNQVGESDVPRGMFGRLMGRMTSEPVKVLQRALKDLPDHPRILMVLGMEYRQAGKKKEACATLQDAYRVAPKDVKIAGPVLHELLHLGESVVAEQIVTEVRALPSLLMGFWIDQGDKVLGCELGDAWAMRFFDEALLVADKERGDDNRGRAYLRIFDTVIENKADGVIDSLLERVRAEMPESGILEYAEALIFFEDTKDEKKFQRLLRKAKRLAQKAGNKPMVNEIEATEALVFGRRNPLLDLLRNFGGDDEWL